MNKFDVFDLMNRNPAFFLATVEEDQPRVRGMMLFRADEAGIIFHTSAMKDLYKQISRNPKVELCFYDPKVNTQLRISGVLEIVEDNELKDEISEHPSRQFLKAWKQSGKLEDFYNTFKVFRLNNGTAVMWTMQSNFAPKESIAL